MARRLLSRKQAERARLIGGPYQAPRGRIGEKLICRYRGRDVRVAGFSYAPIVWPYGYHREGGGPPSLIVCGDLVRAIRIEAALALAYHWGVSRETVAKWRRALKVGRITEGSIRLHMTPYRRADGTMRQQSYRPWTHEEEALLGTAPDQVIAKKVKRSVASVGSHRRYKGIPVYEV